MNKAERRGQTLSDNTYRRSSQVTVQHHDFKCFNTHSEPGNYRDSWSTRNSVLNQARQWNVSQRHLQPSYEYDDDVCIVAASIFSRISIVIIILKCIARILVSDSAKAVSPCLYCMPNSSKQG